MNATTAWSANPVHRARQVPLMGYRGSFDGWAQTPLGEIPRDVLETALAYFTKKVDALAAMPATASDRRLLSGLRHHVEMVSRVLGEPDSESLSYGVRCTSCGEWETACACCKDES